MFNHFKFTKMLFIFFKIILCQNIRIRYIPTGKVDGRGRGIGIYCSSIQWVEWIPGLFQYIRIYANISNYFCSLMMKLMIRTSMIVMIDGQLMMMINI